MRISKFLTISLVVVSFVIGIGTGYMIAPEYEMAASEAKEMNDLGKADKYVDLRYINAMIAHHQDAIHLSTQAKEQSQRTAVLELAEDILSSEPKAIEELYQWKKDWYRDSRKVKTNPIVNLGSYDDKFDLRFLNALIYHHEEGIEMAKEIKFKSSRLEVLNNADEVIDFLNSGLVLLKNWQSEWYVK